MSGWRGGGRGGSRSRRHARAAPLATGWGDRAAAPAGETVVGVFARERLPEVLAAIHGAGYGHAARVFDGTRGDLAAQLTRARLTIEVILPSDSATVAVVAINATGRATAVAETLRAVGASEVTLIANSVTARAGSTWRRDGPAPTAPDAGTDGILP